MKTKQNKKKPLQSTQDISLAFRENLNHKAFILHIHWTFWHHNAKNRYTISTWLILVSSKAGKMKFWKFSSKNVAEIVLIQDD